MWQQQLNEFSPELAALAVFFIVTLSVTLLHSVFTPCVGHFFQSGSFPRSAAFVRSVEGNLTVAIGVMTLPFLIPCKFLFYRFRGVFRAIWNKVCIVYLYLVDIYDSIGKNPKLSAKHIEDTVKNDN